MRYANCSLTFLGPIPNRRNPGRARPPRQWRATPRRRGLGCRGQGHRPPASTAAAPVGMLLSFPGPTALTTPGLAATTPDGTDVAEAPISSAPSPGPCPRAPWLTSRRTSTTSWFTWFRSHLSKCCDQPGDVLPGGGNEVEIRGRRRHQTAVDRPRDVHVGFSVLVAHSDEVVARDVVATLDKGCPRTRGRGSEPALDLVEFCIIHRSNLSPSLTWMLLRTGTRRRHRRPSRSPYPPAALCPWPGR